MLGNSGPMVVADDDDEDDHDDDHEEDEETDNDVTEEWSTS